MSNSLPKALSQTKVLAQRAKLLTSQFPSIFRLFPERALPSSKILSIAKIITIFALSLYLFYATINQAQLLQNKRQYLKKITLQRKNIEKEITYWKQITQSYTNYPDAYLKIAALEYSLGNRQTAKTFIDKALSINPGLESARVLGEQISR